MLAASLGSSHQMPVARTAVTINTVSNIAKCLLGSKIALVENKCSRVRITQNYFRPILTKPKVEPWQTTQRTQSLAPKSHWVLLSYRVLRNSSGFPHICTKKTWSWVYIKFKVSASNWNIYSNKNQHSSEEDTRIQSIYNIVSTIFNYNPQYSIKNYQACTKTGKYDWYTKEKKMWDLTKTLK